MVFLLMQGDNATYFQLNDERIPKSRQPIFPIRRKETFSPSTIRLILSNEKTFSPLVVGGIFYEMSFREWLNKDDV